MEGREDSKCHFCAKKYISEYRLFTFQLRGEIGFGVRTRKVSPSDVPPGNLNIHSSARHPATGVTCFKGFIITAATSPEIQSSPDSSKF